MDETEGERSATCDFDASPMRTLQDELQDAEAVNAAIYRVSALAEGVRALADPDARDMPSPIEWDRSMRAIEGLARLIREATEGAMEPSGELLIATQIRADAKAVRS